jgi:hypothetical protein
MGAPVRMRPASATDFGSTRGANEQARASAIFCAMRSADVK